MSVAMAITSKEKWVTWFVSKHVEGGWRVAVGADSRVAQVEWKGTRPDTRAMSVDINTSSGSDVSVTGVFKMCFIM